MALAHDAAGRPSVETIGGHFDVEAAALELTWDADSGSSSTTPLAAKTAS